MLSAQNQQIVTAYEELNLSLEDIAEQFSFDMIAIKATLMQYSQKYRDDTKKEVSLKFDESEQEEAKRAIVRIMKHSEDEYLVLRAAKYVRDDAEGRLDNPLKGLKSMNVNITMFNQQLLKAREGKERSKLQDKKTVVIEDKSINVESEKVAA